MVKVQKRTLKQMGFVAALVAIPICHFLVFYVFINGSTILLAFKNADNVFTFDNFEFLFDYFCSSDSTLLEALINTLKFFVLGLIMFPVSLLFYIFFTKKYFYINIFKLYSSCHLSSRLW